ncbi:MAG: hypothetical protein WC099_02280 [Candidatus Paceibacterota bacterium]
MFLDTKSRLVVFVFAGISFVVVVCAIYLYGSQDIVSFNGDLVKTEDEVSSSSVLVDNHKGKKYVSERARITIEVPQEAIVEESYDPIDLNLRIDKAYYQTLGITGTTSISLRIMAGVDRETTSVAETYCSLKSYDMNGEYSSKNTIYIEGVSFYEVKDEGVGMNQHREDTKYIEIFEDGWCRFILFRINTANPEVYTDDPLEIQEIKNNNEKVRIKELQNTIIKSIRIK